MRAFHLWLSHRLQIVVNEGECPSGRESVMRAAARRRIVVINWCRQEPSWLDRIGNAILSRSAPDRWASTEGTNVMATYEEPHPIVLSTDEARGGETGHHVRYILGFGLTGVIAAFAAIAIYFGFDALHERASTAFAQSPSDLLRTFAPYAAIALVGAIGGGLLLGLWNILSGRSADTSQTLMRLRVVTQFVLICVIMAIAAYIAR
ncbi:MAG: HIG1 domain-containing protein [Hyphomicrobium sp.]|uniref:HIG1 domain-containing protein n=1 Tax=Hyphomicrobium sp. TaxID=82 RepID=UPI003D0F1FF1